MPTPRPPMKVSSTSIVATLAEPSAPRHPLPAIESDQPDAAPPPSVTININEVPSVTGYSPARCDESTSATDTQQSEAASLSFGARGRWPGSVARDDEQHLRVQGSGQLYVSSGAPAERDHSAARSRSILPDDTGHSSRDSRLDQLAPPRPTRTSDSQHRRRRPDTMLFAPSLQTMMLAIPVGHILHAAQMAEIDTMGRRRRNSTKHRTHWDQTQLPPG